MSKQVFDKDTFTTEVLLAFILKLKQLKSGAQSEAFHPGADPRYKAVEIKVNALLERATKLVPVVMLAEVEGFGQLVKQLYQMFGEPELSETIQKDGTNGH
jgi:hypothetical protein